jgi:hypothetical protein
VSVKRQFIFLKMPECYSPEKSEIAILGQDIVKKEEP